MANELREITENVADFLDTYDVDSQTESRIWLAHRIAEAIYSNNTDFLIAIQASKRKHEQYED